MSKKKQNKGGNQAKGKTLEDKKGVKATEVKTTEVKETPVKPTVYQTAMEMRKLVFMRHVSQIFYVDEKGVENIFEEWKNNTDNSSSTFVFPVSNVKAGDGIDLEKLRAMAQDPKFWHSNPGRKKYMPKDMGPKLEAYEAELSKAKTAAPSATETKVEVPAETKTEVKVETKTEEKENKKPEQKVKPKKEKIATIEAEEVITEDAPITQNSTTNIVTGQSISNVIGKLNGGERFSPDSSVQLLGIMERNFIGKNSILPNKQTEQTEKIFSVMGLTMIIQNFYQLKTDLDNVGMAVRPEMFEVMTKSFDEFFGMKLLGAPSADGKQMHIDFEATVNNSPEPIQKAIKEEAKVVASVEIPEFKEGMSEEEVITNIRTILSMKNGIGDNIKNSLAFAQKAFKLDGADPAQVLATIMNKCGEKPILIFNGLGHAMSGILTNTREPAMSPFSVHSYLKSKVFSGAAEKQLADLTRVFLSNNIKHTLKKDETFESIAAMYGSILSGFNDDLINRIIEESGKETPESVPFKFALDGANTKEVKLNPVKIVKYLKEAYGEGLNGPLLKKKMQEIVNLYSKPINPLVFYTEKSAYADAKK